MMPIEKWRKRFLIELEILEEDRIEHLKKIWSLRARKTQKQFLIKNLYLSFLIP
ncbi:hypothetical protein SAMN05518854_108177 [Variovorax sp. YR266]|nr:hypothetical protein SAMN05518854_108177 [Variovorax sp. YR266]